MHDLQRTVHVNVPFRMLIDTYLPLFIERRLNPEIGFDAEALDLYSHQEYRYVSQELQRHGLAVTLHFPFMDLSLGSPEPGLRELTVRRFEQMLPLIRLFRPKAAVCHTGYDPRRYGLLREVWVGRFLGLWPDFAGRMEREGCPLRLENVYEEGPQEMLELFVAMKGSGVGFCLDTGHQAVFGATPLQEWVGSLHSHLRHVHLHDNYGERDDHMALGEGSIDFELLFGQLKRVLPSPPLITLEPHREEDVFPSLRYLERIWPW